VSRSAFDSTKLTAPGVGSQKMSEKTEPPALLYDRAFDRRGRILAQVLRFGFCTIADLAGQLGVSEMTVRRDVRRLAENGELRIVHGGVSAGQTARRSTEFSTRAVVNADAKRRIAQAAASLVHPGDVIAIDAGTTAFDVITQLPEDFAGSVVTHSIPVLHHVLRMSAVRVTGVGGQLYAPSQAFAGPTTVEQLTGLRVRLFFLGAAAIDRQGVYVEADVERTVKQALVDAADKVILVADHSKFDHTALVHLAGFDRIDRLITDRKPPRLINDQLHDHAVHVTVVA
jgi:DeoR family fructose operon transcriptional repressor